MVFIIIMIIGVLFLHELLHYFIFHLQGVKIIDFSVAFIKFNVIDKKISLSNGILGNVTPKINDIQNFGELLKLNKKFKINLLLTNGIHFIIIIFCCLMLFNQNYQDMKFIIIATLVFNLYIILSSIILKSGDLHISIRIKKQPYLGLKIILVSYMKQNIYSQFINNYINDYIISVKSVISDDIVFLYKSYTYLKCKDHIDFVQSFLIISNDRNIPILRKYYITYIYQLLYYLEYHENYQHEFSFINTKLYSNFEEFKSCENTLDLVLSKNQVSITQLECFFIPYQFFNPEISSELVRLVFEQLKKSNSIRK